MSVASATLYALADLRYHAAVALEPVADTDPAVHVDVVDSLDPPALMLTWDEPWLAVGPASGLPTMGPDAWAARLAVLCIAGRFEPGPGIAALERLVAYTVGRLKADAYSWPFASSTAPRQMKIAGVDYLAARLTYLVPVTI